ncbi:hypothetical protein [Rubrobacter taiwanensis]|jgi:hypothetical protein|nr:hypothetical protein [Rubrobacter taiwanensis]
MKATGAARMGCGGRRTSSANVPRPEAELALDEIYAGIEPLS